MDARGRRSARPAHRIEDGNFRLLGESGGLIVKDNYWIRPASGQAGNTIDFFVKLWGMLAAALGKCTTPAFGKCTT